MTGRRSLSNNSGHPVLDLGHGNAGGRDALIVSASNRVAVEWLEQWPGWPVNATAVAGGRGSGKTHLAEIWRHRAGAMTLPVMAVIEFDLAGYIDRPGHILIDNADRLCNDASYRTQFFHLFNAVREAGKSLLITGRDCPARWPVTLPDLKSRLSALPCVTIDPPDDAMLLALFGKLFADRQVRVGEDVLNYILPRIERSCASVQALVERLDKLALSRQSAITIPLVKSVLDNDINPSLL